MSIITRLVVKYLRLNPKRTLTAVISITFSNVVVWGFEYMKTVEETF